MNKNADKKGTKKGNLNVRFLDDDWAILDELKDVYGIEQTRIVKHALRHLLATKPALVTPRDVSPIHRQSSTERRAMA